MSLTTSLGMRKLAILGTRHQDFGDTTNADFEKALKLVINQCRVQVVFEEWSVTRQKSFAHHLAEALHLVWKDVGTPDLPLFETYDQAIEALGFDVKNLGGITVPRYGPLLAQRAREEAMVKNLGSFSGQWESGLLIIGVSHLHSMMERFENSYEVEGFFWIPCARREQEGTLKSQLF